MKLYHYEHCPYCLRVRVASALLDISLDLETLANDDEATPIGLVGKKVVPILIREDGTPMAESLDIVAYLDKQNILAETISPELENWIKKVSEYQGYLLHPRNIQSDFGEFKTQSAKDYYQTKKSAFIGDFDEAFKDTAIYLKKINQDLLDLEALFKFDFISGMRANLNDVILFPIIRNLTIVQGIKFPPKVAKYLKLMADFTHLAPLNPI